jgi:hydrogenase maturation protease
MVSKKKIAIVGVGNLLMGDDGIGIHVVRKLEKLDLPAYVEVYDAMTNSFMVLEYMDGADKAIIVDAYKGGKKPGSIYKLKFDPAREDYTDRIELSLHDMDFIDALRSGREAYAYPPEIVIIGVEPEVVSLGMELSATLKKAMEEVVKEILAEIEDS